MYIYKITNLINGKIYVGQYSGKDKYYFGSGTILKKAIKKYGKENFSKEIIEDGIEDKETLDEREKYWIKFFNSKDRNAGYNLTDGGGGLLNASQETKDKIRESLGVRSGSCNPFFGKNHAEETKKRQSDVKIGKYLTDEIKEMVSNGKQGNKKAGNYSSKYVGVCFNKECNKWAAVIQKNYERIYLGLFLTEKDAAIAYNKKALEFYGESAKLNFVEEYD